MTLRLDLDAIEGALVCVEREWPWINAQLQILKIGGRAPFTAIVRRNMLSAYEYLDDLLTQDIEPFSDVGMDHMLVLNERIHYGNDRPFAAQFASAIDITVDRFNTSVEPIADWYWQRRRRGDHPNRLAAETYVSIVGQPQLFIEGNHRTAALIGSWIDLRADYPPLVLSVENSVAYFMLSAEIKQFADRSTWRGRRRLPRYRKSFMEFWRAHVDLKYCRAG